MAICCGASLAVLLLIASLSRRSSHSCVATTRKSFLKMRTTDVFFRKISDDEYSSRGSYTHDFDDDSRRKPFPQIYSASNTSSHEQISMTYFPGGDLYRNEDDETASNMTYMQIMSQVDGGGCGATTTDIPDSGILRRPTAGPQCNRYLDMSPRNTITPLETMIDTGDTTTKTFKPLAAAMTSRAARRYYNWPHERSVLGGWWWWSSVDRGDVYAGTAGKRGDDNRGPSISDYYIQPDTSFSCRKYQQQRQHSDRGGGEGRYLPMNGSNNKNKCTN